MGTGTDMGRLLLEGALLPGGGALHGAEEGPGAPGCSPAQAPWREADGGEELGGVGVSTQTANTAPASVPWSYSHVLVVKMKNEDRRAQ